MNTHFDTGSTQLSDRPSPEDTISDIEASRVLSNIRSHCQAAVTAARNSEGKFNAWATLELEWVVDDAETFEDAAAWRLCWLGFFALTALDKVHATKHFATLLATLVENQTENPDA